MSDLPDPARALTLLTRGALRRTLGDEDGAMADFEAVIVNPGAPADILAKALFSRSRHRSEAGDSDGALEDLTTVVTMGGVPSGLRTQALHHRDEIMGRGDSK